MRIRFVMVAFLVAHVKIHDTGWLSSEYMTVAAVIEAKYGGVHVASGVHTQVEGDDLGSITSVLQFPTLQQAHDFWNDPDYQRVAPIRRAGSDSHVVIIDGTEIPAPFAQSPSAS